jgi:sugar/nucleoside kinase (ribokinase family)
VGAGDALVGGFLAWWIGHDFSRLDVLNRRNVRAGIEAAVKIASNTCTRRGAEPPWAHEVEATPGWEWL